MPSKCLDQETLISLVHDTLPPSIRDDTIRHLDDCVNCQAKIENVLGHESQRARGLTKTNHISSRLSDVMNRLIAKPSDPNRDAEYYLKSLSFAFDASLRPEGIGRFAGLEIDGFLGAGGMGIVLKAFDDSLQRNVAMKLLPPSTASHQESRQRFLREARAAAAIDHENVVTIHSVDEFNGLPYLIMQYVEGESLHLLLEKRSPLSPPEVLDLATQTASGLAAAHRKGIIHRDIKPANILMEHDTGKALLTDFGLAQSIREDRLTQSGYAAGTPCFMSPEQANADSLDVRTDLFSLGAVLYTAATGKTPFEADSIYAMIRNVCETTPPSVTELNPNIPDWLSEAIAKLMMKDPDQRFQSAQGFLDELQVKSRPISPQHSVTDPNVNARPDTKSGARHTVMIATGLLILMISVAYAINAFLASDKDGPLQHNLSTGKQLPFRIRGAEASFASLDDAIAGAPEGATIEIWGDGPFLLSNCQIQNKSLVIRSADDSRAILRQRDGVTGPAITAHANLVLERISLEFGAKQFSGFGANRQYPVNSLLVVQGGELVVRDCDFRAQRGGMAVWFEGSRCEIQRTEFDKMFSVGLVWVCTNVSRLSMDRNLLDSMTGIMVMPTMEIADPDFQAEITNCTFRNEIGLHIHPKRHSQLMPKSENLEVPDEGYFSISAQHNLFHTGSLINLRTSVHSLDSRSRVLLEFMVGWNGRENVFSNLECFTSTSRPRFQVYNPLQKSFAEWTADWAEMNSAVAEISFETSAKDYEPPKAIVTQWLEGDPVNQFGAAH